MVHCVSANYFAGVSVTTPKRGKYIFSAARRLSWSRRVCVCVSNKQKARPMVSTHCPVRILVMMATRETTHTFPNSFPAQDNRMNRERKQKYERSPRIRRRETINHCTVTSIWVVSRLVVEIEREKWTLNSIHNEHSNTSRGGNRAPDTHIQFARGEKRMRTRREYWDSRLSSSMPKL